METINFTTLANFTENKRQLEAWNTLFDNRCKYLLYGGAAHGGKSYFIRWAAAGLGMYYHAKYGVEHVPIGLFSKDYPTLKDRQIARIKWEFPEWLGKLRDDRDEGYIFEAAPKYGSWRILLRNLDDPSKYKSAEFAAILVEELTENPVGTFEDLRFRLRFKGVGSEVKFVGATNPDGIGHSWVKKLWITPPPDDPDKEQDRFFFVRSLPTDNPFTTETYLKQLQSMPELKRRAWLEGDWNRFEGQVFTEWRDATHIVEPITLSQNWNYYGAIDLGWNKPFSVGWYAVTPDGRTYLVRELYGNGDWFETKFGKELTATRLAKIIQAVTKKMGINVEYWVGDPAMWNETLRGDDTPKKQHTQGESPAEYMISAGLDLIAGDNARELGMARYREALSVAPDGLPWYQVFRSCYDTIRTIPALVYSKNEASMEDVDTKAEDHCYDRDRYFFMSRPSPKDKEEQKELTPIQAHFEKLKRKMKSEREHEEQQHYEEVQW